MEIAHLLIPLIFLAGSCFVLIITILSFQTIKAIQRVSILEKENITDALMGIYNRRCFDRRIKEEFSRAKRYGLPLSIIMLDIDFFKEINDSYGHRIADHVLAHFGKILHETIREVDIPARYGGDEIVIISPSNDLESAGSLAERIHSVITGFDFSQGMERPPQSPLRCTISVGVASLTPEMNHPDDLIHEADAAMYMAKETGRNRICMDRECKTHKDFS